MIKYTKIEVPFERDTNGTKKMIEGKFMNETVEFLKDNQWSCTEKIDGTNIGIVWDGHNISYQGRNEKSEIPDYLLEDLNNIFGGSVNEELFEQKFGDMKVILFGEGYGNKIQKCGRQYRSDRSFILFDIYIPDKNIWMKREALEDIAKTFGVEAVPIIMTCTLQEAIDFVKSKPKSTIGTANMEGLVCRPLIEVNDRRNKRIIVKIKVKDFC